MFWSGNQRTEFLVFQRPPAREAGAAPNFPDAISGYERPRDALNGGRATYVGTILHVRSDRWPKWACRRAPTRRGHCSNAGGLSAVRREQLYRNPRTRVIAAQTIATAYT
jgi:hypothetical protein